MNKPQLYTLRKSQQEAVDKTIDYFSNKQSHRNTFLWNAVMRWGKCLTSLNFIDQYNKKHPDKKIKDVLVLTFFPQTEDSWNRLLKGGEEWQSNFTDWNYFNVDSKNKKTDPNTVNLHFSSFQQLYSGTDSRSAFLFDREYDLIILDEYHHGAYNARAKGAMRELKERDQLADFDNDFKMNEVLEHDKVLSDKKIKYSMKLVLSGTPYRVMELDGFNDENTFTFTYFEEQRDRLNKGKDSDYVNSPRLSLYSVNLNYLNEREQISKNILRERVKFLLENDLIFNDSSENPFFLNNPNSTSFWLIPRVSDANEIEKYINEFAPGEYNIINLYKGKFRDGSKTLELTREAIKNNKGKRNIILSFNKLTLGVTIREIENVVFLREITSPELYMQAASRSKSPYPDNGLLEMKNDVQIISFDRSVDFSIFSTITNTRHSRETENIREEEFLKLLPIHFVDEKEKGVYELSEADGKDDFLNALKDVKISHMIRNSVSPTVDNIQDIPAHILEALNKVAEIGGKKDPIKKEDIPKTKEEKARSAGRAAGKTAKINNEFYPDKLKASSKEIQVPEKYEKEEFYYRKGFIDGWNWIPKSSVENEKVIDSDESLKGVRYKIELLIRRFIYVLIGTYFVEGRFIDIEEASEEFFENLLGFDKKLFLELYSLNLINTDYIDSVIINFSAVENNNTNHIGLSEERDYEFIDTENEDFDPEKEIIPSTEKIREAVDQINRFEEELKISEPKATYIYVATPSEWLHRTVELARRVLEHNAFEEIKSLAEIILKFYSDLTRGVKIGQTSRTPTVRLEELNGYTRSINDEYLIFDLYGYRDVGEYEITDTKFHKYILNKGYHRVEDDIRREIFDISASDAMDELENFINELEMVKASKGYTNFLDYNIDSVDDHKRVEYDFKLNGKPFSGSIDDFYTEITKWYWAQNPKDCFRLFTSNDSFKFEVTSSNYKVKISENMYIHRWPAFKTKSFELVKYLIEEAAANIVVEIKEKE